MQATGGRVPLDLADIPEAHWQFLEEELRGWYETPTHFFVHANYYPDVPLSEQPDLMLYWEKFDDPRPHESGKIMVCGHTPQKWSSPATSATRCASTPGSTATAGSRVSTSVRENTGRPTSAAKGAAGGCLRQIRAFQAPAEVNEVPDTFVRLSGGYYGYSLPETKRMILDLSALARQSNRI